MECVCACVLVWRWRLHDCCSHVCVDRGVLGVLMAPLVGWRLRQRPVPQCTVRDVLAT
jgi:hypothetical protein